MFITFRLADSLPESILRPWRQAKDLWLQAHPEPWDTATETEYHREFSAAIDGFLDAGHGSCLLRDPACAKITAATLLHFDTDRYLIHAMVVMPNHVHVLLSLSSTWTLEKIIASWKRYSTRALHAHLGHSNGHPGSGPLWQKDYFDRLIRDEPHFRRVVHYLRRNPEKARLREGEYLLYEAE